jgi:plasmid stability protein
MIMISRSLDPPRIAMPDVALRGLSHGLHQALKEAAEQNHRSLNGEILARLEQSFRPSSVAVDVLLARVEARRSRLGSLGLSEKDLRGLKDAGRP